MTQSQEATTQKTNSFIVPPWVFLVSGVICVVIEIASALQVMRRPVPPSLLSLSMSFGAMMMGVATLYRVRGQTGQLVVRMFAGIILAAGLIGPMAYSAQAVAWRSAAQKQEVDNVKLIAAAAYEDAAKTGHYPASFADMLSRKLIKPEILKSPLGPIASIHKLMPEVTEPNAPGKAAEVNDASDYEYWGKDLPKDAPAEIIVVTGKDVIWGSALNIGFADGSQRFVSQEDIEGVRRASDAARAKIGLPPIRKAEK